MKKHILFEGKTKEVCTQILLHEKDSILMKNYKPTIRKDKARPAPWLIYLAPGALDDWFTWSLLENRCYAFAAGYYAGLEAKV